MKVLLALLFAAIASGAALADAPKNSLRPLPRPVLSQPALTTPIEAVASVAVPDMARLRPARRPTAPAATALMEKPDLQPAAAPDKPRSGLLALLAPRPKPARKAAASRKGAVCGVPSIKGKTLPRVTSKTKGCGIDDPVSITSVDGIRLSQAATVDCPTAIALNKWVQQGLRPTMGRSDVVELTIAGHYSCRTRNNQRGGKISEHGRGKAIDIAGVVLSNGKELTVRRNFKTLRKAYKAGCGIFGTTLGPGSDGYHEDHMHFDTARQRRGGAYCR